MRLVKPTTNFSSTPTLVAREALTHDSSVPEDLKGISHELRTPLNVIIGICQLLERDRRTPLSPLHREAVSRLERNAHSLMHSVNRLIDKLRDDNFH